MNDNDTIQMMGITTYMDKVRWLGGLGNAVIRNSIPRWLGQGSCLATKKPLYNWPLPDIMRILYTIKRIVYIILYMGVPVYLKGIVHLTNHIYVEVHCSKNEQLRTEHELTFILWPMRDIVTRVRVIIPTMYHSNRFLMMSHLYEKTKITLNKVWGNLIYNILGLRKSKVL